MKIKNIFHAFLHGKKLFKIKSLDRVFFAIDLENAKSKFASHEDEVEKANIFDLIKGAK
jgi:hypothetical protein